MVPQAVPPLPGMRCSDRGALICRARGTEPNDANTPPSRPPETKLLWEHFARVDRGRSNPLVSNGPTVRGRMRHMSSFQSSLLSAVLGPRFGSSSNRRHPLIHGLRIRVVSLLHVGMTGRSSRSLVSLGGWRQRPVRTTVRSWQSRLLTFSRSHLDLVSGNNFLNHRFHGLDHIPFR